FFDELTEEELASFGIGEMALGPNPEELLPEPVHLPCELLELVLQAKVSVLKFLVRLEERHDLFGLHRGGALFNLHALFLSHPRSPSKRDSIENQTKRLIGELLLGRVARKSESAVLEALGKETEA